MYKVEVNIPPKRWERVLKMNENVLLRKIECLLVKEREYDTDLKNEYYYYRDDLNDEAIKTYGVHGCIVA